MTVKKANPSANGTSRKNGTSKTAKQNGSGTAQSSATSKVKLDPAQATTQGENGQAVENQSTAPAPIGVVLTPPSIKTLDERLMEIQRLDGLKMGIETLKGLETRLSKFKTYASASLQFQIIDSEGEEFVTGNSAFIEENVKISLDMTRSKRKELEGEILSAEL